MVNSYQVIKARIKVNTKNYELFRSSNLEELYELYVVEPILTSLEKFQERDSWWMRILNLTVNINKYKHKQV